MYPGYRYAIAKERLTALLIAADGGDRKAMSDIVHAGEVALVLKTMKSGIDELQPLKGIKAADDALSYLWHAHRIGTEDLTD